MIAALRSIQLLAAALLVGGPAFLAFIWQPSGLAAHATAAVSPADDSLRRRVRAVAWLAVLTLTAGVLADLVRLATDLGQGSGSIGQMATTVFTLLQGTNTGRLAGLRLLLAVGFLISRPWRVKGRLRSAGTLALGAAFLATFSLSGHAAASLGNTGISVLVDLLHLACMAIWYGGLCTFALLPWRHLRDGERLPALVDRFSDLALLTVGLLTATGIYMAGLRLYGFRALVEHPYGQTLVIKLAFFAGVMLLAALNLLYVRPRLKDDAKRAGAGRLLRGLVVGEAIVGMAVVIMAGVLSTSAPPQGEPVRIAVSVDDVQITPASTVIPLNRPVLLTVTNRGTTEHSYVITGMPYELITGGHNHGTTQLLMIHVDLPGESQTVQFIPRQRGTYPVSDMVVTDAPPLATRTITVQ